MKYVTLLSALFLSPAFSQVVLEGIEIKAKKDTLTPFEIRESFAKDPAEALTKIEGVWKLRKGGIANDIVLRGFQRGNLNLLIDGIRIYAACPNRMDPPAFHVDFSEVKDIEVVKGAFDVRNYGSLGGTVSIRTQKPPQGLRGKINLSAGSFSYLNPSVSVSYANRKFYVLLGYSYRYSKPYRDGKGKRFTEYANYKEKDITSFSINTLWTKVGVKPSKDSELSLSYTAQRVRDTLYPYLMMDSPKDDADRLRLSLNYGKLKVLLYNTRVDHLMNNSKRNAPFLMETRAKTNTYGVKAEFSLRGNLSFGFEAFNWNWKATTTMTGKSQNTIPDVDLKNVGAFVEYKKLLSPKLTLTAGLRIDSSKTEADKTLANTKLYYVYHNTRKTSKRDTYPSGNIKLSYRTSKNLEVFAGLGYSVRVPDAQERYFALNRMGDLEAKLGDWVGNPELNPPKNAELDLGVSWRSGRISAEAQVFYSRVKDFITLYKQTAVNPLSTDKDSNTFARSYANTDATLFGGEAKLSYAITDTLFFLGGLSYVRGKKDTKPQLGIRDGDLAEIPPLRTRLALRYDNGESFAELEGVFSSTQSNVDSDLGETKTSGYGIINLRLGREYKRFRVTAGVENLLDKFYYEHLSYLRDPFSTGTKVPEPGRSFYLNLSYSF